MRFQMLQSQPGRFVFELLDDQDSVLLTSDPYPSRDACTDAIRDAIDALPDTLRYDIRDDNSVVLRAASGDVLAKSPPLDSRQEAGARIASIAEAAGRTTGYDVTYTRTRRQTRGALRALQRLSDEELMALYDFTRTSTSGAPGFELFQHDDGQYYFHFNDDQGRPLLFSRGFPTAAKRDRRLESVIQNAGIPKRYDIQEVDGRYYVVIKARNSQEIARSRPLESRDEAERAVALLQERIPPLADQYVKKRHTRTATGGQIYDFSRAAAAGTPGFETYRSNENRRHYFLFNDENGRALLYSQGYVSAKSRNKGIASVIKNGVRPDRYEPKEENGQHYFILRAGNRQEIARSRPFASADDRDRMMAAILAALPAYAARFGVTLETTTETQTERFTLAAPPPVGGDGAGTAAAPAEPERPGTTGAGAAALAGDAGAAAAAASPGRAGGTGPPSPAFETAGVGDEDRGGIRLWIPGIIILLALLALLFFLLRGCGGDIPPESLAGAGATEEAPAADADPPALTDAGPPPADGGGSSGIPPAPPEPAPPLGPDAAALGFAPGSMEARLADLLSDPDRELPAVFTLDRVRFAHQSHDIGREALPQIDNLARLLKAYPDVFIEFQGHIDGTENDDPVNLAGNGRHLPMSTIRARCLYVRMRNRDVPADQLGYRGFGATQPVATDDTSENRQRNRRLEFVVRSK